MSIRLDRLTSEETVYSKCGSCGTVFPNRFLILPKHNIPNTILECRGSFSGAQQISINELLNIRHPHIFIPTQTS